MERRTACAWWAGLSLGLALGCAPSEEPETPAPSDVLRADGTAIVDPDGQPVILRGANLGSWMFVETWISSIDYPWHGRAVVLAEERGLREPVVDALRAVGVFEASEGADWLDRFETAVAERTDASTAAELRTALDELPSLYDDSDLPFRQRLEQRFGTEGRDELLDVFHRAWIRESDVKWMADAGFNLVRVPIGYRTLVRNSDLEAPSSLQWNEDAFARIDDLLDWCEQHRVYAILDIQESPGGHNDYSGPATLYDDPKMQALTVELWTELSRRYRDRTIVAAYSLLAEPFGAPNPAARDEMYDRLVDAIRDEGDEHLLVIHDGFSGMGTLPNPADYGWTGVVYSTHLFEWDLESLAGYEQRIGFFDAVFGAAQDMHDVPYFIGSFSTMRDEPWAYDAAKALREFYETRGWSWSVWTFKRIDDPIEAEVWGTSTSWGLLGRLSEPMQRPDVHLDDYETLERKFADYADLDVQPNAGLVEALAGAPPE